MTDADPSRLWGGRFSAPSDQALLELTSSIEEDMRLFEYDIAATKAHARVLEGAELLTSDERLSLDGALDSLLARRRDGQLAPALDDEDVHALVERLLTEELGDLGKRIHAGRSRNDLVATDLRLWARAESAQILEALSELIDTLADRAEEHTATLMPAYTHLQRAQPITLGFHLAAHAFALLRDGERFQWAAQAADVSPLGAGAVAGSTLELDAGLAATELGFKSSFDNAMDAVADRDFLCDLVYAASLCAVHLSRLCEEIVMWTSSEFAFARLDDSWATGSSMMPQKKNPDLAELVRGRTGGAIADLVGLLTILKGLPFAYNRDLQETKKHAFAAADRIRTSLVAARNLIQALTFDTDRLAEATKEGALWATDLAERLVVRGVPFRSAHEAVGRLVADLESQGVDLAHADGSVLAKHHEALLAEDIDVSDPGRGVEARSAPGGPSRARVAEQLAVIRERAASLRL